MKTETLCIDLWDLIAPVAKTIDMMSAVVAEHHMRAAYFALRLGEALEFPLEERRDLVVAASLHDIGAFSLNERMDVLDFEETKPMQHALASHVLLKSFAPFAAVAPIARFHHVPWGNGEGAHADGEPVPRASHVLHLADRISVLVHERRGVLSRVDAIRERIERRSGEAFVPEHVEAFLHIAGRDALWLEATSDSIESILKRSLGFHRHDVDLDTLLDLAKLLCRVIDFRSEFTATHSSGVAAVAVSLGKQAGFSEEECQKIEIAAFLHDLGKMAIPSEIIEKQAKLTTEEWQTMRTHAYYTFHVLEPIEAFKDITPWGALHQERLNGTGYPFQYKAEDLPMGARVMAVADVFTGITEDRPYRKGMDKNAALDVLTEMAGRQELDGTLVRALAEHFDEANRARAVAQRDAMEAFHAFRKALR